MREIANWVKMEWFALGKIWNFVFFLEKKHQISQNQFVIIKLFAPKAVPSFKMKRSLTEYDSKEQNLDRLKRQKTSTCSSHFFWCCSWFFSNVSLARFLVSMVCFMQLQYMTMCLKTILQPDMFVPSRHIGRIFMHRSHLGDFDSSFWRVSLMG